MSLLHKSSMAIITAFCIALLAPSTASAQDSEQPFVGLGVRIQDPFSTQIANSIGTGTSLNVFVPINVLSNFRLEPDIGFGRTSQTEEAFDNDGDLVLRTDEIASVFRLGVGGFYMLSPGERTNIYFGGRLGFLRFNGEERRDLVNVSDGEERVYVKRNDLVLTVASGGEAYITPYLSIGGEFALDIISQGDPNVQRDPPQQNNNNVVQTGSAILPNGALFIRWFFL